MAATTQFPTSRAKPDQEAWNLLLSFQLFPEMEISSPHLFIFFLDHPFLTPWWRAFSLFSSPAKETNQLSFPF